MIHKLVVTANVVIWTIIVTLWASTFVTALSGCSVRAHLDACTENGCLQDSTSTVTNRDANGPSFWRNINAVMGAPTPLSPATTTTTTVTSEIVPTPIPVTTSILPVPR